jgi:threonine synthase
MDFACVLCGAPAADPLKNRCPCGGAIDVFHDLDRVALHGGAAHVNPLLRYKDLLPFRRDEDAVWLGDGNTPCIPATGLGKLLGMDHLYLKDETSNPTRSTKDRMAAVALSFFRARGVSEFVMASTGNSSTSYGRAVSIVPGFRVHIFVGRDFVHRLNYEDHARVHTYVVEDDFVSAGAAAKEFAGESKIHFEGGFFNLARREGLKLAYLEAFDQMPVTPEFVFQAISSGMGLVGAYKGALEYAALGRLAKVPAFVGVQQETCAPMARAFEEGLDDFDPRHVVRRPQGPAAAILRGDPTQTYPYMREICRTTGGAITSASLEEIETARRMLFEYEGLACCYASATALAGMIRMKRAGRIPAGAPVLVNVTGADRAKRPVPSILRPYVRQGSASKAS